MTAGDVLWTPPAAAATDSRIGRFMTWLEAERSLSFSSYDELWQWSVTDLAGFWGAVWEHFAVEAAEPYEAVLTRAVMPGTRWFPGARLNYALHALRRRDGAPAIVSHSQSRPRSERTWGELATDVAAVRSALVRCGVTPGDRVGAYLPNITETVVAFLAAASLGAVWTSCAPEFGVKAVLDRMTQVQPLVLFAVESYRYGDRLVDRRAELDEIRSHLPTVRTTVVLPYGEPGRPVPDGCVPWSDFVTGGAVTGAGDRATLTFEPVAADHPLYVLFSSGTTGLPKPIVHGHGGILVEHLKALALHGDLGEDDAFFWFSTTGWMMWNYLVSGLTVGSTIVLFDGDPAFPDLGLLWEVAAAERVTWMGVSAPFILACRKAGITPGASFDLGPLRAVGSTGAPLPAEGCEWVYESVKGDVLLSSISGGTDVCTAFVGACPIVPVWSGEIPCRYLGAKVEAFDEHGRSVVGVQGELVVTEPMPSMPIGFWGDEEGARYRDSYFTDFPGVWRHGDWITITDRGSCVITGRSDATLNRGGVRLGTAEFYSVVEALPAVADSLVVHIEDPGGGAGRLVLFVVPTDPTGPTDLTDPTGRTDPVRDALISSVRTALRTSLSPRHVPDEVHLVAAIPRTLSGKKLEVPVKKILTGAEPDAVASRDALVDPSALDAIAVIARTR